MSYIRFDEVALGPAAKTKRWAVFPADETLHPYRRLGTIKWFGRWRCYAFYPEAYTVFEKDCLRDIANFCDRESAALRTLWRNRKKETDL